MPWMRRIVHVHQVKRRMVGELAMVYSVSRSVVSPTLQISVLLLRYRNSSLSPSTNDPLQTFVDHRLLISANCLICFRLCSEALPRMSIDVIVVGSSTFIESCRTHDRSHTILTIVLKFTRTLMTAACLTLSLSSRHEAMASEQVNKISEDREKQAGIISNLWRDVSFLNFYKLSEILWLCVQLMLTSCIRLG